MLSCFKMGRPSQAARDPRQSAFSGLKCSNLRSSQVLHHHYWTQHSSNTFVDVFAGRTAVARPPGKRLRFVSWPQLRCSRNDKPYESMSVARVSFTGGLLEIQKVWDSRTAFRMALCKRPMGLRYILMT